jgi:lipopolysaccharide/colanic/teichoic acid biosynthesis glycosyltransferase
MRPGLTSLSIVRGRDDLSIEEKAEFDREYVYESSLFIDIPIIMRTVLIVLTGKGSN